MAAPPVLLDGRTLSRELNQGLIPRIRALSRPPGLAVILVGSDPASQVYVGRKAAVAERLGIRSWQVNLPADVPESALLEEIDRLNADPDVDGLLVQLPLPAHLRKEAVQDRVRPDKDVDGVHPENTGLLAQGRPRFVACTPAGIMALLAQGNVPLAGATATVVGRSPIVGRPISLLLDQAQATVTVCHSRTRDLEGHVRQADILVAAMGRPQAIPASWIKPGAAVVDVGIHRLEDGGFLGDVEPQAASVARWITPVPGGVGPMTIAMLMASTVRSAEARLSSASGS